MKKILFVFLIVFCMAPTANAQTTNEMRAMVNRLDQLENQVQSFGQANGTPMQPTAGYQSPSSSAVSSLEVRLSALEEQMRQLNGNIEKQNFDIAQLKTRLDKSQADMEMRIGALEQKSIAAVAPAAALTTPPAANDRAPERSLVGDWKPPADKDEPQSAITTPVHTSGDPDQDYDAAYAKMQGKDYAGADAAFRAFLKKYNSNSLASNAQYWLGESLYARTKYSEAVTTFAEGYQKYPKGNKAPDTLLKLGVTLGDLKKPKEACTVFRQLAKDFPTPPGAIATRAEAEMKKLKCS